MTLDQFADGLDRRATLEEATDLYFTNVNEPLFEPLTDEQTLVFLDCYLRHWLIFKPRPTSEHRIEEYLE